MHSATNRKNLILLYLAFTALLLSSCFSSRRIHKMAGKLLFSDSVLANSHTGISIFDPAADKYIYKYQADKFFVPASNVKLLSLYAGLKYIGDSLPGLLYAESADTLYIQGTGDPSFLHRDFVQQPVVDFLKKQTKPIAINISNWQSQAFGNGWMWDDYNDGYMPEKSSLPVYGNVVRWIQIRDSGSIQALAREEAFIYSEPDISWSARFSEDTGAARFSAQRSLRENRFLITQGKEENATVDVPFITNGVESALLLLKENLQKEINITTTPLSNPQTIFSQPADSLYKPMLYRSDNFFAEQTLLMAAQNKWAVLNDAKMMQHLLQNDLKEIPQTPNWADGSGLSRYNLVTADDFVWLLQKLKNEFGMERLKKIFPTGGKGTLLNYYKAENNFIYAKTGTLSGIVCLSGYLYTQSGKLLIFSTLVNNHTQPAWIIRKKVEALLTQVANTY